MKLTDSSGKGDWGLQLREGSSRPGGYSQSCEGLRPAYVLRTASNGYRRGMKTSVLVKHIFELLLQRNAGFRLRENQVSAYPKLRL